jgi:2-polyprenyl-3-methyl-5-hydroxy-6-metoxy-1,4-benzoquinol methylase
MSTPKQTISELGHLEGIAKDSWYAKGTSSAMVRYSFEVFARYIRGQSILEMGPAEGVMTEYLSRLGKPLTLVEGAASFCRDLKQRFPQASVVHSLFEDFETDEQFDNILLGHVLEHVEDPVAVLKSVAGFLAKGGRMISAVPNARSIHRQAAVDMGLLDYEEEMNEMDRRHGHRRVFNPETFRQAFKAAGLRIDVFGGYWLMLHTFMRLGERYPDIAAEIYIVASPMAK